MANEASEVARKAVARAVAAAAKCYPNRVAIRYWHDGECDTGTFAEVGEIVDELALGLLALGIVPGDRVYPVALITLDPEETIPWAARHSLPQDIPSLIDRQEVRDLIQTRLDRVNAKYANVEQIKKLALLDHDLSHEGGELTPTLKVKREVIYER